MSPGSAWLLARRALKWLGIGLLSLLSLALLLFAIVWAINLRDEPLSADAQSMLVVPPNPLRAEDNLYFALVGFDAPTGQSPASIGQARVADYNHKVEQLGLHPGDPEMLLRKPEPDALVFKGKLELPDSYSAYWSEVPSHRESVEQLLGDNRELYERYRALHLKPGYFVTARPSMLTPLAVAPSGVRNLYLAEAVLRMHASDPALRQHSLRDIADDIRMWRKMLVAEDTFVDKMVALAGLHRDELLLAGFIADPDAPVPLGADDAELCAPLFAIEDWNIGNVFRSEFRVQHELDQQLLESVDWLDKDSGGLRGWAVRFSNRVQDHFFQPYATDNLYAAEAMKLISASAPGAPLPQWSNPFTSLRLLYNPIGKTLVFIAQGAYDNYIRRAWDAAALQRLVRLSYEIRRQQVDVPGIPAFLASHPELATHPSDHRPFLWDAKTHTLRVQTLVPQASIPADRMFFVTVWHSALAN